MERDVVPPALIALSASCLYGLDIGESRGRELANELSDLLASVKPVLLTTDFDASLDSLLGALRDIAQGK